MHRSIYSPHIKYVHKKVAASGACEELGKVIEKAGSVPLKKVLIYSVFTLIIKIYEFIRC